MALTYSIDESASLIRVRWDGDPKDQTSADSLKQLLTDPALRPGLNYLSDQRGLESPGTTPLVTGAVHFLQRLAQTQGPFKCAVVVAREASFGMGRMAEAFTSGTDVEVKAFYSIEDAESWLAEPRKPDQEAGPK